MSLLDVSDEKFTFAYTYWHCRWNKSQPFSFLSIHFVFSMVFIEFIFPFFSFFIGSKHFIFQPNGKVCFSFLFKIKTKRISLFFFFDAMFLVISKKFLWMPKSPIPRRKIEFPQKQTTKNGLNYEYSLYCVYVRTFWKQQTWTTK